MNESREIVIDLGGAPRDLGDPPWSRDRPSGRRLLYALACAVVVLATAGASALPAAAPPWRRMTTFATVAADLTWVTGDVVLEQQAAVGPVTVRGLADGSIRWQADLRLDDVYAMAVNGLLLVSGKVRDGSGAGAGVGTAEVVAVDAATGEPRWTRPGSLHSVTPDERLAVLMQGDGAWPQFAGIEVPGGAERWRFDPGQGVSIDNIAEAFGNLLVPQPLPVLDFYLLTRRDGSRLQLRLDSGTTSDISWLPPNSTVSFIDDETIVVDTSVGPLPLPGSSQPTMAMGFDRASRRELWHSAVAGSSLNTLRCGALVCRDVRGAIVATVPRSGEARWTAPNAAIFGLWHRGDGEELIVVQQGDRGGRVVLDAVTGARRADLGAWQAVGLDAGGLVVAIIDDGTTDEKRTWVGLVPASGDLTVTTLGLFGPTGPPVTSCWSKSAWVVCAGLGSLMAVPIRTPATTLPTG
ncbi:hypothetical protein F4553_002252 [Allocatelliglobosispora scoriae]|uniref:Pyrrolo-quinoline quinone repeat domain-containing protein n=1 Tax=Allocatelliglobosispora scoriae TaxID=643052 RepID=A0A841BPK1_9ACTN|nr:PQQ-binding-like beta-propeller repeat protein [Allocatelliglobosispora scoriae]MBB5868873.1 hypothetical protein [Allocatelliglobosispora scoriae]